MRMRTSALVLAATLLLALSSTAWSQQAEEFNGYVVHYNTLNTNMLSPEIAQSYGIQRAGTQAMLNVTILDKESGEPVPATVTATATNLTGQLREVPMREVRDQDAIYYIGQFRIHEEEILDFNVLVEPEGHEGAPYSLDFRQQFYTD